MLGKLTAEEAASSSSSLSCVEGQVQKEGPVHGEMMDEHETNDEILKRKNIDGTPSCVPRKKLRTQETMSAKIDSALSQHTPTTKHSPIEGCRKYYSVLHHQVQRN